MEQPYLGFWEKLEQPFFALAPLANVTDAAFRKFIVKYKKPDVLWTEFVAADGLCHPKGLLALARDLRFDADERPIVAQLFTGNPDNMYRAARMVRELGFDGLDINMGCPDKNVMKQGAGANCMRDPKQAQEIIRAALGGVNGEIPVSVKTRLGYNEDNLEEWLPALLEAQPAVITLHARTKKEMSSVPAHWNRIKDAVLLAKGTGTLIIGNGDVKNIREARTLVRETGCQGVMFGRAIFGNPWLFDETKTKVTVRERLEAALELSAIFLETWKDTKSHSLLKKHYQAYVAGFPGAKELRASMMEARAGKEVAALVEQFLKTHDGTMLISLEEAVLPHH